MLEAQPPEPVPRLTESSDAMRDSNHVSRTASFQQRLPSVGVQNGEARPEGGGQGVDDPPRWRLQPGSLGDAQEPLLPGHPQALLDCPRFVADEGQDLLGHDHIEATIFEGQVEDIGDTKLDVILQTRSVGSVPRTMDETFSDVDPDDMATLGFREVAGSDAHATTHIQDAGHATDLAQLHEKIGGGLPAEVPGEVQVSLKLEQSVCQVGRIVRLWVVHTLHSSALPVGRPAGTPGNASLPETQSVHSTGGLGPRRPGRRLAARG